MQTIGTAAVTSCTSPREAGRSAIVCRSGSTVSAVSFPFVCLRGFERWLGEQPPEAAGEEALQTAQRALVGLAVGFFAGEVSLGVGVVAGAGDRDRVQRPVELAIAAAVQAILRALARGAGDRGAARLAREAAVGAEPLSAGRVPDQDRRGQRPAALFGEQRRAVGPDQLEQLLL